MLLGNTFRIFICETRGKLFKWSAAAAEGVPTLFRFAKEEEWNNERVTLTGEEGNRFAGATAAAVRWRLER